jgi:hypothetical protein
VTLPQVIDVATAYQWWDTSQLSDWLDGRPICAQLKLCIGVLKSAIGEVEAEMLAPKEQ